MLSDKVLQQILKYEGSTPEDSSFDPLLSLETADRVAKGLCKALIENPSQSEVPLKKRIRHDVVKLIHGLCRNKSFSVYDKLETRSDIFIKQLYLNKSNQRSDTKWKYRRRKIDDLLDNDVFRLLESEMQCGNCIDKRELELGLALSHLKSPQCNIALIEIIKKCINTPGQLNDDILEFLRKLWYNENLSIDQNLLDAIAVRLTGFLESKLLNMATLLFENETPDENFDSKSFFTLHFEHSNVLFSRMSRSCLTFFTIFGVLTDILIRSNYSRLVQSLILYIYEEVKVLCGDDVIYLYPEELNSILCYLEMQPDTVKNIPDVYGVIMEEIRKLHKKNEFLFVFALSHRPVWLEHYAELYSCDK